MQSLWIPLLFCFSYGILCQDDDDYYDYCDEYPEDYPDECGDSPNSDEDGCQCSDITLNDGNSGKNIGQCLTAIKGKFWCYVSESSTCSDKKKAARQEGLYYSFLACDGVIYEEPAPQSGRKKVPSGRKRNQKKSKKQQDENED